MTKNVGKQKTKNHKEFKQNDGKMQKFQTINQKIKQKLKKYKRKKKQKITTIFKKC